MSAMQGIEVSERTVRLAVIILSITGISVLVLLAFLSDVDDVSLSELGEHEGETIRTVGTVVGQDMEGAGASRVLIMEGTIEVEVYIERSERHLRPGDHLKVTGTVVDDGYDLSITVQSDRGVEIIEHGTVQDHGPDIEPFSAVRLNGTLITRSIHYGTSSNLELMIDGEEGPRFIRVRAMLMDQDPRSGDHLEVTGISQEDGTLVCYGGGSVVIVYRPEPVTTTLLGILDRIWETPSNVPIGKTDIKAFVKYEPLSTTLYISDEPEGSSISIKVRLPERDPTLHRGDLILLRNCTFRWEGEGMRYTVVSEGAGVITAHGPWRISLKTLDYGISSFEGTEVLIEGSISEEGNATYLIDGPSRLEIRSKGGSPIGLETEILGIVVYDIHRNGFFLEVKGDLV